MDDLISRQVAIEAIDSVLAEDESCKVWFKLAVKNLPSVHPEIVRCKECKWYELPSHKITENCVRLMKSNGILLPIKPNDYCSYAERRTDEESD